MVNTDNIHSSGVSKVTGVVHVLEKAILDRQYLQGTLMPSQNELCRLYGVSARTMREAFKILEAKGLVTVSQGRRPYVNTNSLDQYVDSPCGTGGVLRQDTVRLRGQASCRQEA